MSRKQQYLAGLRAGIPVVVGYVPVGMAYAIMARQAGLSVLETVFMSMMVFAGASQMMAAGMFAQGASIAAMIVATFILNLRHAIMSTCVFSRMQKATCTTRLLAAFGVTDESFAIFATQSDQHANAPFFFGLITATYSSWVAGSAVGAVAALLLPEILSASLGIALYAMFLGLLTPGAKKNARLVLLIVLTAAVHSILCLWIASSWALILATLICAGLGVFFVDPDAKEDAQHEA
ncbi:MAG: AzlC family ABC transporter permease [Christensenellales bacterium]|jgi:4-azaleucine resistance transporter AzlC